jgi:hypothetical protein
MYADQMTTAQLTTAKWVNTFIRTIHTNFAPEHFTLHF